MNIFILDDSQELSAIYHVNKHVVKMPLESAQLLCNAHHYCGKRNDIPYNLTHKNHPLSIWTRSSLRNYKWLCNFGLHICNEYTYRYDKIHGSQSVIRWCSKNLPEIEDIGITKFILTMPDQYKSNDIVYSYRKYYISEKKHLFAWKRRNIPKWIIDERLI